MYMRHWIVKVLLGVPSLGIFYSGLQLIVNIPLVPPMSFQRPKRFMSRTNVDCSFLRVSWIDYSISFSRCFCDRIIPDKHWELLLILIMQREIKLGRLTGNAGAFAGFRTLRVFAGVLRTSPTSPPSDSRPLLSKRVDLNWVAFLLPWVSIT